MFFYFLAHLSILGAMAMEHSSTPENREPERMEIEESGSELPSDSELKRGESLGSAS